MKRAPDLFFLHWLCSVTLQLSMLHMCCAVHMLSICLCTVLYITKLTLNSIQDLYKVKHISLAYIITREQ